MLLCHYSVPQVSKHERLLHTEHLGALMYLASIYERLGECGAHGSYHLPTGWQGGRVVRVLDFESVGPGFESHSEHFMDLFHGSPEL